MANQENPIEQLWYAYSRIGLDSGGTGQRPRAASPGLSEVKSGRVKSLTYYLRYDLPEGAISFASPSNAPVCLAFAQTPQERILVHKLYVGPALGRDGTFFIHVLAGLPDTFSAEDAISLWDADFWKQAQRDCELRERTDASLRDDDLRKTYLDPIPLSKLLQWRRDVRPVHAPDVKRIKEYFPLITEAYLTKKALSGQPQNKQAGLQKPQLYIAAPDHEITLYIAGLTTCLPKQFVKDLTFSTYELDLAPTEIVGACWLSGERAEHDPQAWELFTNRRYLQKLTLNCYLPVSHLPPLKDSPFIEYHDLAAPFAQTATEYYLGKNKQLKKRYERFLQRAERTPTITLKQFFQLHNELFSPEKQHYYDLEEALTPETPADWEDTVQWLGNHENRLRLLNRAIGEAEWWLSQGRGAVINLCQHEGAAFARVNSPHEAPTLARILSPHERPTLARVLSQVAYLAISYVVNIVVEEAPGAAAALAERKKVEKSISFGIAIDVIYCAAPPERDAAVWLSLYDRLHTIAYFFDFLRTQPEVYAQLMGIWEKTLPFPRQELSPASARKETPLWPSRIVIPPRRNLEAMLPATWLDFGKSLTLDASLAWSERAARKLLDASVLTPEQAQELAESYHEQIRTFLYQLGQTQTREPQKVAADVFNALALAAYPEKIDLLYVLLMSAMVVKEEHIARLLKLAELSPAENVQFFALYGSECIARFRESQALLQRVKQLLEDLPETDFRVFQQSSSPDEATPIEGLLWFLVEAQIPDINSHRCFQWYNVACAIRNPLLFTNNIEAIATSMSELLWSSPFSQAARTKLFQALAEVCIVAQNNLEGVVEQVYDKILPEALWQLLHTIAELAGSRMHWDARKNIIGYILFALHFSANFQDKNERWLFVQSFFNTLLKEVDRRLLKWINTQMGKQGSQDARTWKSFASQFTPLPAPELSALERRWFNHERAIALKRFKQAIKSNDLDKVGQVAIRYATTLSYHKASLSTEELEKELEALVVLDGLEDLALRNYTLLHPSLLHVVEQATPPATQLPASVPAQPGLIRRWRQRHQAFAQIRGAFRSGSIGRIVLVKKVHRELLEQNRSKKPHWWERIEVAEQFFNACQQADAAGEQERVKAERAIDRAGNAIEELRLRDNFAPGLNVHEHVRREEARLYQERQYRYTKLYIKREYKPFSLRPAKDADAAQQTQKRKR